MLSQLGDKVNKIGTAFTECMECKDKCQDSKEEIECLDTPDHHEYPHGLAKSKAIKLKPKHCIL